MSNNGYKPGASLRMWRDYFPAAEIVGLDIDSDILFTEDRIKTFQCDQTDAASIAAVKNKISDIKFDVIIDDGLHRPHAAFCFFDNMIDRLADGGIYIIEDVPPTNFAEYADHFGDQYLVEFIFSSGGRFNVSGLIKITRR